MNVKGRTPSGVFLTICRRAYLTAALFLSFQRTVMTAARGVFSYAPAIPTGYGVDSIESCKRFLCNLLNENTPNQVAHEQESLARLAFDTVMTERGEATVFVGKKFLIVLR
ncbi:hypothetical protein M6D81_19200 [Paenibacillus sp. J5C_2022]|uniref:hypothetical protein n=1 Tax=Paenibacillus sp. J5C2022 TaxID=2977129 RepID=UPI0021D0A335|nr:hypothetical protein [Paenibacillus sp. J5C2022]MCU6710824.1 hypothetical protein [Paenibacillus sp. J5C2022]